MYLDDDYHNKLSESLKNFPKFDLSNFGGDQPYQTGRWPSEDKLSEHTTWLAKYLHERELAREQQRVWEILKDEGLNNGN